jgi:iron(III) transport system permease protein
MNRWRLATGLFLFLFAGLPLLSVLDELRRLPESWRVWHEGDRIVRLAGTSLLLVAGTLAIAVPGGLVLAVLLFKTDLPGRRLGQVLVLMAAFVPLPLVVTACQMAWAAVFPATSGWAWPIGLMPAVIFHGLLGLPWCAIFIGLGLRWVEPEMEEDALQVWPAPAVLVLVSLRRAFPAVVFAALVTGLSAWSEMAVTDFARLRTFAEEVYLQFAGGGQDDRASAIAVCLPFVAAVVVLTGLAIAWWQRHLPDRAALARSPRLYPLGRWRWPAAGLTAMCGAALAGPLAWGLLWKAGLRYATAEQPGEPTWDVWLLMAGYARELIGRRDLLVASGLLAAGSGLAAGTLALLSAWLSRGCRWFEALVWLLAAALWATPGPVLGVGWLSLIQGLLDLPGSSVIRLLLYDRPSPLPNLWICTLRFYPVALALLWPVVRLLPRELEEAAALDGLGPARRFVSVVVPMLRGPVLWTACVVAVLTLGEISASKLTATPGFTPLAHHIFQQMHASADTELAALALVLLTVVGLGSLLVLVLLPGLFRNLAWPELAGPDPPARD